MPTTKIPPIALALSGGGIRAMVFHLGVLQCLAEKQLLEQVSHVSTVSGGSLILGLIFQESGMKWPSSLEYLQDILPALKKKLCSHSLIGGMVRQLRYPRNLPYLFSRANLVAGALREEWGVSGQLKDLPVSPEWSINGTTAETGKRFRFKRNDLGDYMIGYASTNSFALAEALAVSAAFPGGIGPLVFNVKGFEWKKRDWHEPLEAAKVVEPPYDRLHLYDGGVYDNLGLEPFFDTGTGNIKTEFPVGTSIIASDAGAPLAQGFSYFKLNPWRMKRVADIMSDQSRALRIRTFINYVKSGTGRGSYLYIREPITHERDCISADFASNFPTTLRQLTESEFDKILIHGNKVAHKKHKHSGLTGIKVNESLPESTVEFLAN